MSLELYSISNALESLLYAAKAEAEENDGVIPDDLSDKIDAMQGAKTDNLLMLGRAYKNHLGEAEALRAEIKRLQSRVAAQERMAEWIHGYVVRCGLKPGEKLTDTVVSYSWRKSTRVEIELGAVIPQEYCKVEITPSKTELKKAILAGEKITGVEIVEHNSLQIR